MFIAVDGIDGAGKTTLVGQLADRFRSAGTTVVVTKEPTSESPWGQALKASADNGRLPREQEIEFFHKDRLHHIANIIQPALDAGHTVICDRYIDSTLAFQAVDILDADKLYAKFAPEILVPDVTFILKCTVEIGLERIRRRNQGSLSTFENKETLLKARSIYESRRGPNYEFLEATGTIEATYFQAIRALKRRFPNFPLEPDSANPAVKWTSAAG
jgi:dTMP kinase